MTRLMLALLTLTFVVGAPVDASARSPRRTYSAPVHTKGSAEVLSAYDKLYVAEVVSVYEDEKGPTITMKTLHRYKGKVSKRTTFTPEQSCRGLQEGHLGEPIPKEHVWGFPGFSPGSPYFVMWRGGECGVMAIRWHDSPVDLETWRTQRDEQMTRASATSVARHVANHLDETLCPVTPSFESFDTEKVAAADLVVAGKIVKISGLEATLHTDSVYVSRPESFSAEGIPFKRKTLKFGLLKSSPTTKLNGKRVIVLAHTNNEGALEASGCEEGLRAYGDRPFPDKLKGLVPISAEQLTCPSLRTMSEDAAASSVVFHATVKESSRITGTTQRVTLSGVRVYKGGDLQEAITVKTYSPFTTSSFPLFERGRDVLAFGNFNDAGEFVVDRCGATKHSPRPELFEFQTPREDIFRCAATTPEKKDMDAADVVGVGRLVRVDGSQSPPVAEFVMSSFYKGAALSGEGRLRVRAPENVASFAHDLDTLLFLQATPTAGVFALTSCGVQGLADGLTPMTAVMHGHEAVSYDPHAHKSSCAAAAPAAPSRAPLLYLFVLLGALAAGRVRRDEALGRPRRR